MHNYKILAQASVATADGETDLYTVPVPVDNRSDANVVQTAITSILLCEQDGETDVTFDMWLKKDMSTGSGSVEELIFKGLAIGGNETRMLNLGLVLPGDNDGSGKASGLVIQVFGTGDVSVNILGVENKR